MSSLSVSAPFIHRPIATSLLGVAVLLGGILGYWLLPVSSLPQVDFPTIQVTSQYPGASPDTVAALVTGPLERQFGQIPSLTTMTSASSFGISQITLLFDLSRDIDGAAQDVQSAINAARSTLPSNLPYPPTYSKVNPADAPIMTLALTSDAISIRALSDLADTLLAQRLSEVSGVGRVTVQGGLKPAVRIQADLGRLAAYGVSLEDVRAAISGANTSGPKGQLDGVNQAYMIASNDQITNADAYNPIVIAYRNGAPVQLRDVADVVDGLENTRVGAWYQGKPAVVLDIQRQPGANVIDTVTRLNRELPRLQRVIPQSATLTIVSDRTATIQASVHDVQFTLVLAVILVVAVVFLFLRTVRATIIAGVALPLSLVATFGGMWFFGFSLDNLSLMALTIGTGFVIDDAIVMIENIVRHMEDGEDPMSAALRGAREIGFTVISLTVSLIAVFIPLLFMTGLVGRMFREFALTLTIAVIASAVVSLTLTPMMCARILRRTEERPQGRFSQGAAAAIDRTVEFYRTSLEWVLARQRATLWLTFATLAATVLLYVFIPKGFLPTQDTGLIIAITEAGPEVSFAEMSQLQQKVSDVVRQDPDVTGVVSIVGVTTINPTPNAGRLTIALKPRNDRHDFVTEIAERLQSSVASLPGIRVYFLPVQDIQIGTSTSRAQYQYKLTGADAGEISRWSNLLTERLKKSPLLRDVASESQDGGLRMMIKVDREVAGRLGASMQLINDTLNDAYGQRQISTIYGQANQYRVILEAKPEYQRDPSSLSKIYIPASAASQPLAISSTQNATPALASSTPAAQIPISVLASIERTTAPLVIHHDEQFPTAIISFNLAQGASLSEAVDEIGKVEAEIKLPGSIAGSYSGDAEEFGRSLASEPWLILAAAITIYIVLGVLYESFIHPLTILSTLPSAGVGALLALMLFGQDLSIVALIGIILLMGIVKKNAIMMIDFALEGERTEGLTPRDAIVKASLLRFRPIMMTTLAALLGALPLALENGTGSELRFPLGITIIGGLLLSQLMTLYTTPVIYLTLERIRVHGFRRPRPVPQPAE
jgi:multidrug efflux pump